MMIMMIMLARSESGKEANIEINFENHHIKASNNSKFFIFKSDNPGSTRYLNRQRFKE